MEVGQKNCFDTLQLTNNPPCPKKIQKFLNLKTALLPLG